MRTGNAIPFGMTPRGEMRSGLLRHFLLIHLALFSSPVPAEQLSGVVIEVLDGDSLRLRTESGNVEVRLADIDAPELRQPLGRDARTSLREMCLLKLATVESRGKDRNGRTLGSVQCPGVDANAEQVKRGMAWVFYRYAPKDSPLYTHEREARLAIRGIWADPNAIPPWDWRRQK